MGTRHATSLKLVALTLIREGSHNAGRSLESAAGSSELLPLLTSSMIANVPMNVVVGHVVGFAEEGTPCS